MPYVKKRTSVNLHKKTSARTQLELKYNQWNQRYFASTEVVSSAESNVPVMRNLWKLQFTGAMDESIVCPLVNN